MHYYNSDFGVYVCKYTYFILCDSDGFKILIYPPLRFRLSHDLYTIVDWYMRQ